MLLIGLGAKNLSPSLLLIALLSHQRSTWTGAPEVVERAAPAGSAKVPCSVAAGGSVFI